MSTLFTPLTLRSLQIPNRVWMSPMCMYSAAPEGEETGAPTDFHLAHLASRAAGGTGLVMAEATAVSGPTGASRPGTWACGTTASRKRSPASPDSSPRTVPCRPSSSPTPAARPRRTSPWQADRPGRPGRGRLAARRRPARSPTTAPAPRRADRRPDPALVRHFAGPARRALAAGFQIAEIHGAHGYLINAFLSPDSNHRTDAYGGASRTAIRFALEVVDAVRAVWPEDQPVFFRTSATDWLTENSEDTREGWTGDDTVRLAAGLRAHGVDLLDVSTGGTLRAPRSSPARTTRCPSPPGRPPRQPCRPPPCGSSPTPQQAEDIITSGQADAVFLGRELLRNPYWAQHAALALDAEPTWPDQYAYVVKRRKH
ncbi:oxidoreductase [Streptomyces purpurascens]